MFIDDYIKTNNLKEGYQVHNLYKTSFCIGDFDNFKTLDEAQKEAVKRLEQDNNDTILRIIVERFFVREDGHICYDTTRKWLLNK